MDPGTSSAGQRARRETPAPRSAWVVAALVGVAVLSGCVVDQEPPEDEAAALRPVETLVIHPTTFAERVETMGSVEVPEDARLTAQAGGTVVHAESEGAVVAPGDVVVQLDPRLAEAGLERAREVVADARAALTHAEREHRASEPLAEAGLISPDDFERIVTQLEQARARLGQAVAQEREAAERLDHTRVRAPFHGTLESRLVRAGEQVMAGQEVARVIGDERAEITAGIPERFAAEIQVGAPASVRLSAYGLEDREGEVGFVSRAIDPRSRTFRIRIDFDDPEARLRTGMIARLSVVRSTVPDALVLPLEIVLVEEGMRSVLVVAPIGASDAGPGDLGVVERRPIVVGPRSDADVIVEEGLRMGDQVIVRGRFQVAPGDTVSVERRHGDLDAYRRSLEAGGVPR